MAILITGGTGFLGRHLTRHLLRSGEKDLVLLDSTPNLAAIADVAAQVKVVPGDVLEPTALISSAPAGYAILCLRSGSTASAPPMCSRWPGLPASPGWST